MADDAMTDSESDIESAKFNKNGKILYTPLKTGGNKHKCQILRSSFIGLVCLLTGLVMGFYASQFLTAYFGHSGSETISTTSSTDISNEFSGIISGNKRDRKQRRKPRANEAKCAARRCCNIIDGLTNSDLPKGLTCKKLSDEECGEYDEFCEWECNPSKTKNRKQKRKYLGISVFDGDVEEPIDDDIDNNIGPEPYEDCLKYGKFIVTDDCGVQYEETLNDKELEAFCKFHKKSDSSFKNDGIDVQDMNADDGDFDIAMNHRRMKVLGSDDRVKVKSVSYPTSSVMYLGFKTQSGGWARCTATMISPRWAITAAHCLYGKGDFSSGWRLIRDVLSCNDRIDSNKFFAIEAAVLSEWKTSPSSKYDIGLLRLSNDPGRGYLDFGYNEDIKGTSYMNIISYPGDKPDCSKWIQYCPYQEWWEYKIRTQHCDTAGGASGSSVYKYYNTTGDRIIYAIHSTATTTKNSATRITPSAYNFICSKVEMDDPGHCNNEHNTDKQIGIHQDDIEDPIF